MKKKQVNTKEAMLIKRIKSLEEFLGVRFCPSDEVDGYNEHLGEKNWGIDARIQKLESRLDKADGAGSIKGVNPR